MSNAFHEQFVELYPEIKRLARARLRESSGLAGLNTTALVHEGFLRLADQHLMPGATRGQFFAYVGQVFRSVVIDHHRRQASDKRGGDQQMLTLSAAAEVAAPLASPVDLIALDRALQQMRDLDLPLYELVEMHTFAGLTLDEIAELRGVTTRTINRDLFKARALLRQLLG